MKQSPFYRLEIIEAGGVKRSKVYKYESFPDLGHDMIDALTDEYTIAIMVERVTKLENGS